MRTVWEIIYNRQMALHYTAPPVCEVIFSGSSNPVIILSENPLGQITGLVLEGTGFFRLRWNIFPGAICYNVYFIGGGNVAVLLAECISDPFYDIPPGTGPGEVIVTGITTQGETPPSDPEILPGGGGPTNGVSVTTVCDQATRSGFPGVFRISRGAQTTGNLIVGFTMGGTANNGVHYSAIPTFTTIPHGSNFVFVNINPVDAAISTLRTVTLTLNESANYFVDAPASASLILKPSIYRIQGYGTTEPLFVPPAAAVNADHCEWDGTFNLDRPLSDPPNAWWYEDSENVFVEPKSTIQDKQIYFTFLGGPSGARNTRGEIIGEIWQVSIFCLVDTPEQGIIPILVWTGTRPTGPTGVYTRESSEGSDMRANITIEQFP